LKNKVLFLLEIVILSRVDVFFCIFCGDGVDLSMVKCLIEQKADLNAVIDEGVTLLMTSVCYGQRIESELVRF
jgi:hypothetical protein